MRFFRKKSNESKDKDKIKNNKQNISNSENSNKNNNSADGNNNQNYQLVTKKVIKQTRKKKNISIIRRRLFFTSLIFFLILPAIFIGYLNLQGKSVFLKPIIERANLSIDASKRLFEEQFYNIMDLLKIAVQQDFIISKNKIECEKYFYTICSSIEYISAAYSGYEDGSVYLSTKKGPLNIDIDPRKRPWYIKAKREKKTIITDFYIDAVTNDQTVTVASPIYDGAKLIGVVGFDIYLKNFIDMIEKFYTSSLFKILIYDRYNKIIYSIDKKEIGKKINPEYFLKNRILLKVGYRNGKEVFEKFLILKSHSELLNLNFIALISEKYILKTFNVFLFNYIIIALIIIFIFILIDLIFIKRFLKPITELSKHFIIVSSGDLSYFKNRFRKGTELYNLIASFNFLLDSFKNIIKRIKNLSLTLNNIVFENNKIISTLSEFANNEATAVEEISSILEESFSSINQISENAKVSKERISEGAKKAEEGAKLLNEIVKNINEISEHSQKIESSLDLIYELTEQTNLLALNASIEAARAGETGKGFSVVASEIRKLAERSSKTASEISDRIKQNNLIVEKAMKLINTSQETFNEIINITLESSRIITEISQAIVEQAEGSKEIISSIDSINESTQEIVEIVDKIKQIGDTILKESKELYAYSFKFKIPDNDTKK